MKTKFFKILLLSTVFFAACTSEYDALEDGIYADLATDKGNIIIKLHQVEVPLAVANFITLAEGTNPKVTDSLKGKRYYDGLNFHRVIKDFMIQGGDPLGTGAGNPGYRFQDEFPKDSTGNLIYKHDSKGVLSMANSGVSTNGSQFFITHKATPWLDGVHSVFGKVVEGLDVVDSIAQKDVLKSVTIVRKGDLAEAFDAPAVFTQQIANFEKAEQDRLLKQADAQKAFMEKMEVAKATATSSGLKILELKKGKGALIKESDEVEVFYTLHLATGKLVQSNEGSSPLKFKLNDPQRPMIPGFKEGVLTMKKGTKARLFIPYYLAYGEKGGGPFPPKADVIFDIEVVNVSK